LAKQIVEFKIPKVFADDETYEVKINDDLIKITTRLEQNTSGLENLTGLKAHGNVKLSADNKGIFNITKITIEFPFLIGKKIDIGSGMNVKQNCVLCINRLIEVIRFETRKYWITPISEHDILGYSTYRIDDDGKRIDEFLQDFGSGLGFPITEIEQSQVNESINRKLKEGIDVKIYHNLFLDSVNYYITRRFHEAVILSNTALEFLTFSYLNFIINKRFENNEDKKKNLLKKIKDAHLNPKLSTVFFEIAGDSLKNYNYPWSKYDYARKMRTKLIHGYGGRISEKETRDTLTYISETMHWILTGKFQYPPNYGFCDLIKNKHRFET